MRTKKNIRTTVHAAIQVLLSLAIVFNLVSGSIHELDEHSPKHEQACTTENEQDACHRYVYHHEESQACNGSHEHLSKTAKECFGCNYFKERQHDGFSGNYQNRFYFSSTSLNFSDKETPVSFSELRYFYLRGPPAIG